MKIETCTLYILEPSEYFYQISLKSIHIISSYTVAKLGRFFETQCYKIITSWKITCNDRRILHSNEVKVLIGLNGKIFTSLQLQIKSTSYVEELRYFKK